MGVRIGLLASRADLAVEVAGAAARAGATLQALDDVSDGGELDLILVDVAAAPTRPCTGHGMKRTGGAGPPTVVLCRADEVVGAQAVALSVRASHVLELPLGAGWLASQLDPPTHSGVLAVLGAVGGVGTSTVAIACAAAGAVELGGAGGASGASGAGGAGGDGERSGSGLSLLIDADPSSPGLDLPLGIAEGQGVRWSGIPNADAPLDADSLRAALPTVDHIAVLTGSMQAAGPGRLVAVTAVGRAEYHRTVLDLGRGPVPPGLLAPPDTVALVVPATVAGVVAARRVMSDLPVNDVLLLVRPTGWLPVAEVALQLGPDPVIEIPRLSRAPELADCGDLLSGRTGRSLRRMGAEVWSAIG